MNNHLFNSNKSNTVSVKCFKTTLQRMATLLLVFPVFRLAGFTANTDSNLSFEDHENFLEFIQTLDFDSYLERSKHDEKPCFSTEVKYKTIQKFYFFSKAFYEFKSYEIFNDIKELIKKRLGPSDQNINLMDGSISKDIKKYLENNASVIKQTITEYFAFLKKLVSLEKNSDILVAIYNLTKITSAMQKMSIKKDEKLDMEETYTLISNIIQFMKINFDNYEKNKFYIKIVENEAKLNEITNPNNNIDNEIPVNVFVAGRNINSNISINNQNNIKKESEDSINGNTNTPSKNTNNDKTEIETPFTSETEWLTQIVHIIRDKKYVNMQTLENLENLLKEMVEVQPTDFFAYFILEGITKEELIDSNDENKKLLDKKVDLLEKFREQLLGIYKNFLTDFFGNNYFFNQEYLKNHKIPFDQMKNSEWFAENKIETIRFMVHFFIILSKISKNLSRRDNNLFYSSWYQMIIELLKKNDTLNLLQSLIDIFDKINNILFCLFNEKEIFGPNSVESIEILYNYFINEDVEIGIFIDNFYEFFVKVG